ncbi:MAG: hypothetical protein ACRD1G_00970, partial [Acidimicrobiales bacterium]
ALVEGWQGGAELMNSSAPEFRLPSPLEELHDDTRQRRRASVGSGILRTQGRRVPDRRGQQQAFELDEFIAGFEESAGINRHGGGDGRALRRRASDPR